MNIHALRRRLRARPRRSGQALVEFALTLPILLLVIFGLVDFARAWSAHHVIADAAREGARMLVVYNTTEWDTRIADAKAVIEDRLTTARLDETKAQVSFVPLDAKPGRGEPMTVTIDYEYDFWIVGLLMDLAGNETVNLVSTITMRTE